MVIINVMLNRGGRVFFPKFYSYMEGIKMIKLLLNVRDKMKYKVVSYAESEYECITCR